MATSRAEEVDELIRNRRAGKHRAARVEAALDRELTERPDIGPAARAALRSQARAIDTAEAMGAPDLVTSANRVYLEMRQADRLAGPVEATPDPFGELLATLAMPGPGSTG